MFISYPKLSLLVYFFSENIELPSLLVLAMPSSLTQSLTQHYIHACHFFCFMLNFSLSSVSTLRNLIRTHIAL